MRIVIDTNVIASAIFFGGKPRELISLIMKQSVDTFVTQEIIEEYLDTIEYLKNKYPQKKIQLPLSQIISACKLIETKSNIKICRDPDDDKFIACAIDGNCIYIVSGDNDLLSLNEYKNIKIVTVAEFLSSIS